MKLHELFPEISLNPASAKDIKQWILQLAVEGKLTKKWRERFNRNLDWKKDILENLVSVSRGITFPKSEKSKTYSTGKIACLRTTNVQDLIEWDDLLYIDEFYVKNNGQYLKEGDIVMSMANSKELVGKVAIIENFNFDKASFGGFLAVLRSEVFSSKFLLYLLRSPQVKARLISSSSQTTNIANISVGRLNKLELFIPPLEEQQAIVSIVEDLFKEVDELAQQATQRIELKRSYAQAALKRLCEAETTAEWKQLVSVIPEIFNEKQTIKTLRETILQLAVQGKLTAKWRGANPSLSPASELLEQIKAEKAQLIKEKKIKAEKPLPKIEADEIPFELPEGWVWCRLGEICEIKGGKRLPAGYQLKRNVSPYIYLRVSDMKNGTIDDSDLHYLDEEIYQIIKNYKISKNDIYMTIVGATIGKCGLVPDRFDGCNLTENAVKIKPYTISKEFLYQLLTIPFAQLQFNDKTKKVGVEKLSIINFKSTLLPIPSIEEQQIIIEKVNDLIGLCDELEKDVEEREKLLGKLSVG